MLRSLGEAVGVARRGTAALMAMGVLVERLEQDQAEARARVRRALRGVRVASSSARSCEETFG